MIVEDDTETLAANLVNETISSQDGKLSAIFIAPSSLMDFIGFLFTAFYCKIRAVSHLPNAVGYIKSAKLELSSTANINYSLDSRPHQAERITLQTIPQAIAVNTGGRYKIAHKIKVHEAAKDTAKIKSLRQLVAEPARRRHSGHVVFAPSSANLSDAKWQ